MNIRKIWRKRPNYTTWAHLLDSSGNITSSNTNSAGTASDSANSQSRTWTDTVEVDSSVTASTAYTSIYVGDIIRAAQAFNVDSYCTLQEVWVRMKKVGLPTGNATCVIYDATGTFGDVSSDVPNNVVTGTSDNYDVSTLTTTDTWVRFTYTTKPKLLPDHHYFLSINYNDAGSTAAKCPMLGYNTTGLNGGTSATYIAAWTKSSNVYAFRVLGTTSGR